MTLDEYLKQADESERRKKETKLCRDNRRVFLDMMDIDGFELITKITNAGTTDIISPNYKERQGNA
jgi:hypothetical protein